jgi:SagB-type dehydrogenase family enzyme
MLFVSWGCKEVTMVFSVISAAAFGFLPSLLPIQLPLPSSFESPPIQEIMEARRSVRSFVPDDSLTADQLSLLLWASAGQSGTRGRRTVPSAGATYPLTVMCVIDRVSGIAPGIYRYASEENLLVPERPGSNFTELLTEACLNQRWMGSAAVTLILTAEYERTTSHYGERGIRYVDMEAGHAGQNIYLQATALGLGTCAVGAFHENEVADLLRLEEGVTPLYIFPVGTPR